MLNVMELQVGQKLTGLSFVVAPGEVVALVGSQGSGKTTLIRALAGLEPITAGRFTVVGVAQGSETMPWKVGVAGKAWEASPYVTVREHLKLFAGLFSVPEGRCLEVAKAGELSNLLDTRCAKLRPGELARLRLVRALLHDPPVLLLDEPIGDVDRESQAILSFLIGEAADSGKAVLLTTFGHPRVVELATRLLYLEDGRLLVPAAPAPVLADDSGAAAPDVGIAPATGATNRPGTMEPHAEPIRHVAARRGERVMLYAPVEIRYAYAQEKMVYIQTSDGPAQVNFSLAELEERLLSDGFLRCHRGFVVNVAWVKEIASWTRDSFSLILKDGKEVPLSKHRLQAMRRHLGL